MDDALAAAATAMAEAVGLGVVGPEAPLAAGLVDALADANVPTFGPTKAAARLEASQGFAKDFMKRFAIPTAAYGAFDDAAAAREYQLHGH